MNFKKSGLEATSCKLNWVVFAFGWTACSFVLFITISGEEMNA